MKPIRILRNITITLLTTILLLGQVPFVAVAAPVPPGISIAKEDGGEYLGDEADEYLIFTANYPSYKSNKNYQLHIYHKNAEGVELKIASQAIYGAESETPLYVTGTDNLSAGVHGYKAVLVESGGAGVLNPVLESEYFNWERNQVQIGLTSNAPFVGSHSSYSSEENYPKITLNINQYVGNENYTYYTFDIANDKLVDSYVADSYKESIFDPPKFQDGMIYYQTFLAHTDASVTRQADLRNIVSSSNIVSKIRLPWTVDIDSLNGLGITQDTIAGGGEYTTYLVERSTGKIFWNSQENRMSWDAGYLNHPDGTSDWAIAYIADVWTGTAPTMVNQLTDVRANSDKTINDLVLQSGVENIQEIAGGWNPSEACTQNCVGDPVNIYTGEFFDTQTDLSLVGAGLTPNVTRHFSTQRKDVLGAMGYGWRNSYEMKIEPTVAGQSLNTTEGINVIQENGSLVSFTKNADGSYTAAPRVKATLTRDITTGNFVFIRNSSDTFTFITSGLLSKVSDINGNLLALNYTGNKLTTVVDARGNSLTFAYNVDGTISQVASQNGSAVVYTYNAKRLVSVVDGKGSSVSYGYDNKRRITTITDARGGILKNTYDATNRITKQVDQNGKALTFVYDGDVTTDSSTSTTLKYASGKVVIEEYVKGLLIKKTENPDTALSRSFYYTYDVSNNLVGTLNPDQSSTSSTYDDSGNMITSTNAAGAKTVMTYDTLGNLLTSTNALSQTTTFEYDVNSNMISQISPQGYKTSFEWNLDGTLKSVVDARGNVDGAIAGDFKTVILYNAQGLPVTTENALGYKTTTNYDTLGRASSVIDGLGSVAGANPVDHQSSITYNAMNIPISTKNAAGNESFMTYDASGNVLTITDALGNITTNTYDLMSNLLTTTDAKGSIASFTYDGVGRKISSTDELGKITTFNYDKLDRMLTSKDPLGQIITYSYDNMDRITTIKDALGKITKFSYDASGNAVKSIDPLGNVNYSSYNQIGQKVNETDPEGRIMSYEYNNDGQLTKTTHPDETITTSAYDEVGNLLVKTNAKGKTQKWTYDALNRSTSYTNENNEVESYIYDANSNLISITRHDGSQVVTSYNVINQPVTVDYPGTESDVSLTYNNVGNVLTETMDGRTTTTTYDELGRILARGEVGQVVSYTYDNRHQMATLTYPSGRVVSYAYNDNGNVASLTSAGVGTASFSYNKNNMLTSSVLPNGVTETITLDALNRQTDLLVMNSTLELYKNSRTYSKTGNLLTTSIATAGISPVVETYAHDLMNRTTSSQSTLLNATGEYGYDTTGAINKVKNQNVINDDTGKPLSVGNKTLTYDSLGNRISEIVAIDSNSAATRNNVWNENGSLSGTQTLTGAIENNDNVSYKYSADGLISERTSNGITNKFVWDSTTENALLLSDGEYEYIYGVNRVPLAQIKMSDGVITYLHTSQNGSVVAGTTATGVLAGQVNYTTYGEQLGYSVSNFGFAGEWKDKNTGYIYLRARWYDSKTASFISLDPAIQISNESYGYVNGNPLTRIDPSGLFVMTMPNPLNAITAMKKDILDPLTNKVKNGIEKSKQAINTVNNVIGSTIKKGAETIGKVTSEAVRTIVSAGVTAAKNAVEWVVDNSSNLSSIIGIIGFGMGFITPLQPLAAALGVISLGLGVIAVTEGVKDCREGSCNVRGLVFDSIGVVSGGAGVGFKIASKFNKLKLFPTRRGIYGNIRKSKKTDAIGALNAASGLLVGSLSKKPC